MGMASSALARTVAVVALLAWGGAGASLLAQQPPRTAPPAPAQARPAAPPADPEEAGDATTRAGSPPQEQDTATPAEDDDAGLPVSLDRIRRRAADERAPVFTLPEREIPTFAVEVERRLPSFWDFVQPGELDPGPVGATSPYHSEIMSMITPPQARPYGSFVNGQLLLVALQSLLTGYAGRQVPGWIEHALREQREAQARREVQAVVDELERRKAAADALERREAAEEAAGQKTPQPPDPPQS
jgi:hypothetical protein